MKHKLLITALSFSFLTNVFLQEKPVPFFSLGGSDKGLIIQTGAFYKEIEWDIKYLIVSPRQ